MTTIRTRTLLSLAAAPLLVSLAHAQQPAPVSVDEFAQRRAALAKSLPQGIFVALGGREPDVDYISFFQRTNFRYLTGVEESNAALVGLKRGDSVQWTLFVQPNSASREVWSGRRVGPERAHERWGVTGRGIQQLNQFMDSVLSTVDTMSIVAQRGDTGRLTLDDQQIGEWLKKHPNVVVRDASRSVSALRAYKSPAEIALLKRAIDLTVQAHAEAARTIRPNAWEYEVDAIISHTFRRGGAERSGFASIVGSGPNATTLHYNANNRQMKDGEMVVVDIGASYEGYSADMTRSYPVNGTFSKAQRDIYQVVLDAHKAAVRQAKNGARARSMADSASATLAAGLARLGLIESPTATYDCSADGARQCTQLSLFYMHGLGHGIGLEVHDPDRYEIEGNLGVGSIFTIEPGVYVRSNLLEILPRTPRNDALAEKLKPLLVKYQNIGVRIEDDYLITEQGLEWLTRGPREISEIEQAMRRRMQ